MRGMGGVYRRGRVYWIRYHQRGREYRESARSADRADALRLLRRRVSDLNHARPTDEARATFEQLAEDYIQERTLRGVPPARLQWSRARVANLATVFGGVRAVEITTPAMREYAKARRALGAAPGTVNRDLGVLSRMFTLALQAGGLSRRPYIPRLPEGPPRQGFMGRPATLVEAHTSGSVAPGMEGAEALARRGEPNHDFIAGLPPPFRVRRVDAELKPAY